MSGPWDRPSSPSPDDQDWPAEDFEPSSPSAGTPDPWSSEDPWSQPTPDASPGWDVWPTPAPLPDDYVIEEPEPPSSDPWAESWSDDVAGIPSAGEAPSAPPPSVSEAPRVEPWAPDQDPWAASVEAWSPAEPWRDEPEAEPAPVEPAPEPIAPAPPMEPQVEQEAEPDDEGRSAAERDFDVPPEVASDLPNETPPEVELEPVEPALEPPGVEREPAVDAAIAPEEIPPPERAEPGWEPDLWEAELPGAVAAPEPEPEPEPEPQVETADELDDAPPHERQAEATTEGEPEAEPQPGWQSDRWPEHAEATQVLPTSWTPPPPPRSDERSELEPAAGSVRTSLVRRDDLEDEEDLAAQPSTAEQAVPWLIGVILLLAGMVIVLLALIFAGDASLGGTGALPSASAEGIIPVASSATATPTPAETQRAVASATPVPTATPPPAPAYGPLEMVYQGRSTANAPIYLLHRDFTVDEEPEVLARDPNLDVRRFAWAPDGTVGAGLYSDLLISIEPGVQKRTLGDEISAITFGDDGGTVYGVRITQDGADDVATILGIGFASGDTSELAAITYPRPEIAEENALHEAKFADDGGTVRLYWMEDGMLRLWSLGAGSWEIDPSDGAVTKLDGSTPVLWSPDGERRVTLMPSARTTAIRLHDGEDEEPVATTTIEGVVSHIRWSPDGARVVFTVGRSASGGGVLQDLFLWDLEDGQAPMQLTSTGAAFGAEWRGAVPRWHTE